MFDPWSQRNSQQAASQEMNWLKPCKFNGEQESVLASATDELFRKKIYLVGKK
jgi:hypothetical protein